MSDNSSLGNNAAHKFRPDMPGPGALYHERVGKYLGEMILHATLYPTESSLDLLSQAFRKALEEGGYWRVLENAANTLAEYEITVI